MCSYHSKTIMIDDRFTISNGELAACASDLELPPGSFFSTISLKSPKTGDVVVFNAAGTGYNGRVFHYAATTTTGKFVKLDGFHD